MSTGVDLAWGNLTANSPEVRAASGSLLFGVMTYVAEVLADSPLIYLRLNDDLPSNPVAATASTALGIEPASYAIDGRPISYYTTNAVVTGWLRVQLNAPAVVTTYMIWRRDDLPNRNIKDWTFEGSNDGTTFTTLDTRTGVTWPTAGEVKTFSFSNTTAYLYYRVNFTANNGDASYTSIAGIAFGRIVDSSGNARHATTVPGAITYRVTSGMVGDTDKAVTIGAAGGGIIREHGSWMNTSAHTVEAIIKTTSTGVRAIGDRDGEGGGQRGFQFRLNAGKLEYLTIGGAAGVVTAASPGVVNDGVWHHVAASYDASNIRLYVDGVLVTTQAAAGALPVVTTALGVGFHRESTPAAWFGGSIDEFAYYGTRLSDARIAAHAVAASLAGAPGGMIGYWGILQATS